MTGFGNNSRCFCEGFPERLNGSGKTQPECWLHQSMDWAPRLNTNLSHFWVAECSVTSHLMFLLSYLPLHDSLYAFKYKTNLSFLKMLSCRYFAIATRKKDKSHELPTERLAKSLLLVTEVPRKVTVRRRMEELIAYNLFLSNSQSQVVFLLLLPERKGWMAYLRLRFLSLIGTIDISSLVVLLW